MVAVILALAIMLVPSWGGAAHATTYYVSTTGSNSNDGLTESTPKRTITHCVSLMVAGDTCLVRGGTYSTESTIQFGVTGTAAAPIRLANYPGETPIIDWGTRALGDSILIQNSNGYALAIGWITIEGFEITNGYDGIKIYNLHDGVIRNNWIHNNYNQGILGNGTRVLIERNIINHQGPFTETPTSNKEHGIYFHGSHVTILNNLIYDNLAYGIQQNGSASAIYSATRHPAQEFAGANNWIVANNTFAYSQNRAGYVVWGSLCDDSRYENNIFYENGVTFNETQGIHCASCTGSTGLIIKNNHYYASGSGATTGNHASLVGTISGNVINVSAPAFINGGSNALPASPDFRLTARAPVNIALTNEFPTNGVVGAFQPPAQPTASMATHKITVTLPLSTAVPVQTLSTAGVTISCPSTVCPGSPAVSSVTAAADAIVEIPLSGITSNACVSHTDPVTISYASGSGTWTGNDNIGPYPGLHQKILSFTNLAVVNNCNGSGPPGSTPSHISYPMENGTGTTVSDTSGNGLHGTTSGTWVSGKTGFGINVANGSTQQTTIPYGSGINPTSQSMTWVVPVFIPSGQTSTTRYLFGPEIGTDQRGYIGASGGTWRVARQSTSISAAGASNLAVVEGWNYLVARWDSTAATVTLCNNGVTGTGGATGSYASYTFATNFEFPMIGTNLHTTVPEATFDDVQIFTSLQDCAALYAAWSAPPPPHAGTLKQAAIRFGGVVLNTDGNPIVLGSLSHGISVPKRGGAVILFEVKCNAGTDCDQTAFRLVYVKNGVTTWQQVPNTETADGTWMWGASTEARLNNGSRATSLTGSCTMQTGATLMTADQVPPLALAQNTCTVMAYIVHVDGVAGVDYFDYKVRTHDNADLPGGYDEIARIRVVNPMGGGAGY